jgi:hypothetical protein
VPEFFRRIKSEHASGFIPVFPEILEDFMSSAVLSTSAAQGRFFVFDAEALEVWPDEVCPDREASQTRLTAKALAGPASRQVSSEDLSQRKERWLGMTTPASRLAVRPAPEMVSSGIAEIDALAGGLPRGCLTEIFGPASSGRTTLLLAALTAATRRGEVCAVVDASDAFDPLSAVAAGIDLDRLLWVRCREELPQSHPSASLKACTEKKKSDKQTFKFEQSESRSAEYRLEQLLRATDLLLESGGFGLIALDLSDLPPQAARRIPLTTWFRFRRAVEPTPTVLLAFERQSIAGSCSSLLIKLGSTKLGAAGNRTKEMKAAQVPELAHARLLTTLEITAEMVRSRLERKPAGSVSATFASKTAWAG